MPTIPTMKENQRLSAGGANPFQNSSNARLTGEAIADVGTAVNRFAAASAKEIKDDPTLRTVWLNKTKARAEAKAAELQTTMRGASIDNMGDKFSEQYDQAMNDFKARVLEEVPEQYRLYADEVYDTAKYKQQVDVFKIAGDQRKRFENNAITSTFGDLNNSVKIDPRKYQSAVNEAAMLHDSLIQSGKLSPERISDNKKAIAKNLTDSAIDGWVSQPKSELDMPLFNNATKVLNDNRALYSEDEFSKRADQIETAKHTFLSRTWTMNDRADAAKEKAFAEKQNAEVDQIVLDIYESQNDPQKVEMLKMDLADKIGRGKMNYIRERAFKSLKLADDIRNDAMSSEISNLLGMNPTRSTAEGVFDMLNTALANNQIDTPTHKYWQNYVRNVMDKNKADPNYSKKMSAMLKQLQSDYKISNLENLTDIDSANTKAFLADQAKLYRLAVQTGDPFHAYSIVKSTYFQKQRSMGAPGNYPYSDLTGEVIEDQEAINKEINYIKDAPSMPLQEKRRRMQELKKIEDGVKAKKRLDSKYFDNFKQQLDNTLPAQTQIPLMR